MIRTGEQYRASLRQRRDIRLDGEPVEDVTTHPVFQPLVDTRARLYDLQHAPATRDILSLDDGNERQAIGNKLPLTKQDWWDKRRAIDTLQEAAGGWVGRLGAETAGEMWSLFDGQDVLNDIDPAYSANLRAHIHRLLHDDPFMICAGSDVQAAPEQIVHGVRETDAGLVVSGTVRAAMAAYANWAYVRPTQARWPADGRSSQALGFVCDLDLPGLRFVCRRPAQAGAPSQSSMLARQLDDVSTDLVFDQVVIPWHHVLFYRHTRAAVFVRATQDRYATFARLQRSLALADLLLGVAVLAVRMAGAAAPAGDPLLPLASYREGIQAHLTAAITLAERSPGGLMMPQQSLLHAGRALAHARLATMVSTVRALSDALRGVAARGAMAEAGRDRLLAYAKDLLESRYLAALLARGASAQAGGAGALTAMRAHIDWEQPAAKVGRAIGLPELLAQDDGRDRPARAPTRWFRPD